ncbi:MAG: hypothetical protein AVDCRST_MAG14-2003, partial [uncultured Rubrobacteraceae bacterium]
AISGRPSRVPGLPVRRGGPQARISRPRGQIAGYYHRRIFYRTAAHLHNPYVTLL